MMGRAWFSASRGDAPQRPGRTRRAALGSAAAALLLFLGLQAWWVSTAAPGLAHGSQVVEIPAQTGLLSMARRLGEARVIRSPLGFTLLSVIRGSARALKAGEYEFPQGATTLDVLALLEAGRIRQRTVLLREGATLEDLARLLEAERLAPARDVLRAAHDRVVLRRLDIDADSAEGYLFPDTYQFVKGVTVEELLARMVARMRERMTPELREQARARELGVHQLLTLASIIEKEAVERSEMPLISAVFWNRLKRDMPLQADPTVQYAIGKNGRALSREDLQVDSPFNTYRRVGLPPGPIASPGRAAMEAAVNPARVDYLYFVSMDDRRHHFSSSLEDHNSAVARYRLARPR
ncbi:MAG: endolytic transglycosylase MltG [Candidatus Rokubacteria bacterium]|nr:endolytic transglycosylase MltG [Candidatus Rokubacteria bacterium]